MKQQSISYTDSRELQDDGLGKYLEDIRFIERLDKQDRFSREEFRQILGTNLGAYFKGERTADFVIGLAVRVYPEVMVLVKEDEILMTVVCELSDLEYERINGKKVSYSKEQIDKIFQRNLLLLTEKQH